MSARRRERLFLQGANSHRILLLLPFSSSHWTLLTLHLCMPWKVASLGFCLPSSSSQQRLHCFAWEVEELKVKEQLGLLAYFYIEQVAKCTGADLGDIRPINL